MELIPADLGDSRAIALFQLRAAQVNTGQHSARRLRSTTVLPSGKSNGLIRFWAKETGLVGEAGELAVRSVSGQLYGILFGIGGGLGLNLGIQSFVMALAAHQPIPATVMGIGSLAGFTVATAIPRVMLRRWSKTLLTNHEIDALLQAEEDELERSYLLLIREALAQKNLPEAAQKELKEAIKILGLALDRLPPVPAGTAQRDTTSLRAEARGLREQAHQELDRVAAESLERRADALERSAVAMEKSATLLRRNSLLRQELQAQLEALRLELGSTVATGADASSLVQVSQVARGVAREADALATARAELDSPQRQRVGVG